MPADAASRGVASDGRGYALVTTGVVLVVRPFETLSDAWRSLWDEEARSEPMNVVTFSLEPRGETVTLTVTHGQIPDRASYIERLEGGWPVVLANLKAFLETGSASNQRDETPGEPVARQIRLSCANALDIVRDARTPSRRSTTLGGISLNDGPNDSGDPFTGVIRSIVLAPNRSFAPDSV